MANVQDIAQISSYTGSQNIGGAIDAPVIIDPAPVQRYATFKYYSDQAKWDQKQKDDATAANQIAKVTAFDITSPLTPYSDALKGKLKDIQDFMRANPNSTVYSRDQGAYQELQNKINDFNGLRQSATASDAVYAANKNAIDIEPDLNKKAYLQADLDTRKKELFAGGVDAAKNKVLASSSPLKPDDYKVPDAKITTYDVISTTPNADIVNGFKFINLDQLKADSELLASGFNKAPLDETTPAFKALSPERQNLERQRNAISTSQRQNIANISTSFNSLLEEWKAAHPDQDITKVEGEPTGGDTLMDNIKSANKYNSQIDQLNALIVGGKYKDPTGRVVTQQFDKLNLADGLSEAEIIMMQALQKSGASIWSLDKKITETDNAIQLSAQAETRKNNIREDATRRYIANLPYEKQKAGAVDAAGNAIDFGNLIYGINSPSNASVKITKLDGSEVSGLKINNGVIIDKAGNPVDYSGDVTVAASNFDNSIITEFNKYAGATKVNSNGEATQTTPTAQLVPENGHFLIRMENGTVKGIKTTDGTFATADQFQHITMEAGQKGVTKYKKPDANYGKFDTAKPAAEGTINISNVPTGVKPEQKNGKYYYKGKEIIF